MTQHHQEDDEPIQSEERRGSPTNFYKHNQSIKTTNQNPSSENLITSIATHRTLAVK